MRRPAQPFPSFPRASSAGRTLRRALGVSLISLGLASPAWATINVNKTFTPDALADKSRPANTSGSAARAGVRERTRLYNVER